MIDDAKLIEYYISYRWLDLGPDDTYIDIAAQDCPFAFFVRDTFGCQAYRQDLFYLEKGIHGSDIGGNAAPDPPRHRLGVEDVASQLARAFRRQE